MKKNSLIILFLVIFVACGGIWYNVYNLIDYNYLYSKNIVPDNYNSDDALFAAVSKGEIKKIEELIDAGANVNAVNKNGNPLLYAAIETRQLSVFNFLLEHQVTVSDDVLQKNTGDTLLHAAVYHGQFDMVEALLQYNLNTNIKNNEGEVPILKMFGMMDATSEDLIRMTDLLVAGGANVNTYDNNGVSPLMYAYYEGKDKLIEHLLALGAEGEMKTKEDARNILKHLFVDTDKEFNIAFSISNYAAIELYFKAGYDPNLRTANEHLTYIHQTAFSGDVEMTKLLLEYGADPNIPDKEYGNTPLWEAVSRNNYKMVELLLDNGAKNLENNAGWTPLMVAKDEQHTSLITLIEQYIKQLDGQKETLQPNLSSIPEPTDEIRKGDGSRKGTDFYSPGGFVVYENNNETLSFATKEEAIEYASMLENAEVWEEYTTLLWDNIACSVYVDRNWIGDYSTKREAIEVARTYEKSMVINQSTQENEWDITFEVYNN